MAISVEKIIPHRKPRVKKLDKFSNMYFIPKAVLSAVPKNARKRAGFTTYKDMTCQNCKRTFHKRSGLENHMIEDHGGKIPTKKKSSKSATTKYKKKINLNETFTEDCDISEISIIEEDSDISIISDVSVIEDDYDSDLSIIENDYIDSIYDEISVINLIEEFTPSSQPLLHSSPKKASPKKLKTDEKNKEDLIISFPLGEYEWMENYPVFTPEIWLSGKLNKALRSANNANDSENEVEETEIEMVEEIEMPNSRKRPSVSSIIKGTNKRAKNTNGSQVLNISSENNNCENLLDLSELSQAVNKFLDEDVTMVDDNVKKHQTKQSNLSDLLISEGSDDDEVECINLE